MNKKSIIIITVEILIIISLYIFINSNYIEIIPKCWIYQNTKILCPACGGTRCLINLLKGNWIEAFFSNMIFFVTFIYLGILNIIYIINLNKEKKVAVWLYPKYWYVIIFAIFLIIYTIVRNLL
ncbi:MAG: DUF2752 domain-containing protein [Clostridia bacterium]|nr:DUF2752 domain-containing protein [Clostridia bacterium]